MARQHNGKHKASLAKKPSDDAKTKRDKKSRKIQANRKSGTGSRVGDMSMKMVVATSTACTTGRVNCRCITCLLNKDKEEQAAKQARYWSGQTW